MKPHPFPSLVLLGAAMLSAPAQAADIDLNQPVRQVAARTPAAFTDVSAGRVVEFTLWQSDIPVSQMVGSMTAGGLYCGKGKPVPYTKDLDSWLVTQLAKVFKERSAAFGLAPGSSRSVFDDKGGGGADYRLGATLLALDYRTCGRQDVKGEAYAQVKWELFSARRQKVVYSSTVEASHAATDSVEARQFDAAFMRAIIDNLLGDPVFAETIRSGGAQEGPAKVHASLPIRPGPIIAGGVGQAATELRAAVVTVESGIASGSGFYISGDGHLLTNAHVVGDAKFVRLRLAGGRTLVGEVLRVDKARDVALLQADPPAAGALAVRTTAPQVGEEVYALGSPYGQVLSGTLTRGVLSASRVLEGVAYLQSDVAINAGHSGGPLMDAQGRVMGIAQLSNAKGVGLFIPIDDALDKLALVLQADAAAPRASTR